jgi:hypothetical protein
LALEGLDRVDVDNVAFGCIRPPTLLAPMTRVIVLAPAADEALPLVARPTRERFGKVGAAPSAIVPHLVALERFLASMETRGRRIIGEMRGEFGQS